jgi:hypothetical protein
MMRRRRGKEEERMRREERAEEEEKGQKRKWRGQGKSITREEKENRGGEERIRRVD